MNWLTNEQRLQIIEFYYQNQSQQLGFCYSTTWKILRKDLGVKPFKIQLVQELKPHDLPQRLTFGEWALAKLDEDPFFIGKLCSATKLISGWMNTWISKIAVFGVKNSQKHCKNCQCIPKKNALFDVDYGPVASLDFFKDDKGRNITVKGERWLGWHVA